jgi:hypothetical protein
MYCLRETGWGGWADVWHACAEKSALQVGDPCKYYLPSYIQVFLMISFLNIFLATAEPDSLLLASCQLLNWFDLST